MARKSTPWTDKEIGDEIREVMRIKNIERMPTSSEILGLDDFSGLSQAISVNGGFKKWAVKLKIASLSANYNIKKLSEDEISHAFKMREQGYKLWEIAERFGVGITCISNNLKKYAEIEELKTNEKMEPEKVVIKIDSTKQSQDEYHREQLESEKKRLKERFAFMYNK